MVDKLSSLASLDVNATANPSSGGADLMEQPLAQVGEQDLEYLNQYLASTCFTLLNVNKDLFYKELHEPLN